GSATVQVSGGSAPYTYSWSPSGGSQATATGLSAGVYVVTVEDSNGCSDTQSFTITQPASGVNASPAMQTNIACFGGSNGSATVQVSGGSAPYTYSWSPSGGSQAFANGLSAGDYVVTVQDSNGCTDTQSFTITQPDILVSSIESQTNIGCGEPNLGSATVAVSGGTAPYFYSWSPSGGSDATATGLSAGTYTVTITDSNSCQTSQEITITEVESPTLTANDTETICTDESVTLSPTTNAINTQGFVGDFASTNWTQSSQSSNGSITFNETDAIMISSDGLSGLGFNQAVITIPYNTTISFDWNYTTVDGAQYDYPQIFLNGNLQFINGYSTLGSFTQSGTQTITLEAGDLFGFRMVSTDNTLGAATTTINNFQVQTTQYQWVASNGGSIDGASDQLNLEVSTAGTYTLTVTTSQGCSASKSIEVVESQTAVPTVDNQVIYSATATVADLTAVGENLAWYASETSETALSSETALVSGTYYVSQTTNGCESARAAFEVTIVPVGIEATSCNTTLNSAFYDFVFAIEVPNATQYEFKIVAGANEQTVVKNTNSFKFNDFGSFNFTYGTTYAVSVRVEINNAWTDYSDACPVTVTPTPLSEMQVFCNQTMPGINSKIYFLFVPQATEYRYSVTNVLTNDEQFVITTQRFFYITSIPNYNFNTEYSVKCQVKIGDQFGDFGPACVLTTPAAPTSLLRTQFCNSTLTSINQNVFADVTVGATAYKFKVENNGNEQEIERPDSRFSMAFANGIQPSTVYNVSVALFFNGAWQPYGPVCTLTTPALPVLQLRPEYCNTTLSTLNENFYSEIVVGATAYKFKLENNGSMQEIERPDSRFSMAFASGIQPNTLYNVTVSVLYNDVWQAYGDVCTITTPALPTTQLRTQFCGSSVMSLGSNFYANVVVGASAYRFKTMISGEEEVVERTDSRCFISAFAGAMANQTYPIQVATKIGENWSEYGPVCNLTVGNVTSKEILEETINYFDIKAYPSPFTSHFSLLLSHQELKSDVTVYDMMGKQIQKLSTLENEVSFETSDWAAGVYLIQIMQGQEVKSIRMVKQ
uniref:T9SS type A sorting domain-containing protein n=2 Tax=Flavobacterium sp. TaxID=239 RepID=UPI0040491557